MSAKPENYKIVKVLNNNCIIVLGETTGEEMILTGKGIGFGKDGGKAVELSKEKIEKYYLPFDEKLKKDYLKMIESIDGQVFDVCTEIIIMAEEKLGRMNTRLHLVLTDHISFALERLKMNMEIHNPFLIEISNMYRDEFAVAKWARDLIQEKLHVHFNDDEVGFIALHLYSARQNLDVKVTLKNTRIIKELVDIIESELDFKIENDLTYNRLINHLKGALDRSAEKIQVENPLLQMLKTEFKDSFQIAEKISAKILQDLNIEIPDEELGYMTIHIDRVRRMAKIGAHK